jgi:hypothetical protein
VAVVVDQAKAHMPHQAKEALVVVVMAAVANQDKVLDTTMPLMESQVQAAAAALAEHTVLDLSTAAKAVAVVS